MDTQRTILWVIFSVSLLMLWDNWQRHTGKPSMFGGPAITAPAARDSSARTAPGDVPVASAPAAAAAATPPGPAGADANAAAPATTPVVKIRTDVLALDVSTQGAEIQRAELLQHRDANDNNKNVVLLDRSKERVYLAQSGLLGSPDAPNHKSMFVANAGPHEMVSGDTLEVSFTAEAGNLQLVKTYMLRRGAYDIEVRYVVTNKGAAPVSPTLYMQILRDGNKPEGESRFYQTFTGPAFYTDEAKFQKIDFGDIEKGKADHAKLADNGWVGLIQHYFLSAWLPTDKARREYYTRKVDTNLYAAGAIQDLPAVAPGESVTATTRFYVGPQDQKVLEKLSPGLDLSVDYGWLTVIAKPIFWLLTQLHAVVGNWGWAIIALTIIIKLAFFPLSAASYRSMARMKKITPRLTKIRDQYANDKAKQQQAMMELYRTEKINPLGGCLPIVVQIPVFIALYWVLLASVEMRNAPWLGWIQDLAAPDPFYILPLVMAASMFLQTKMNPTPPDPIQAKMMMFMPIVFSIFFFFFPAGLVLYWLVNNILSIGQQWYINRMIERGEDKEAKAA